MKLPDEEAPTVASELRYLWRQAGRPSTRDIALSTGNLISHSAVGTALSGKRVSRWLTIKAITEVLGGDTDEMLRVWDGTGALTRPSDFNNEPKSDDLVTAINRLAVAIETLAATKG